MAGVFVIIFNFESLFGRALPDLGFSLPSFVNLAVWGSFKAGITEGNDLLSKAVFHFGKYLWLIVTIAGALIILLLLFKGVFGPTTVVAMLLTLLLILGLIFSPLLTILVIIILFVCSLGYYWYKKRKP